MLPLSLLQELEGLDADLVGFAFDAFGTMFKSHATTYLPIYSELLAEVVETTSHPDCVMHDRALALFLIDDVFEFCGDGAADPETGELYIARYMPILLRAAMEDSEELRQASLYGLGVLAETCPLSFPPYVGDALKAICFAIDNPTNGRRSTVEDNAATALGKFLLNIYSAAVPPAEGLPPRDDIMVKFLLSMPLRLDYDEAKVAAHMLCTMLDNRDVHLLGDINGNPDGVDVPRLTHALSVLAYSIRAPNVTSEYLSARILKTLLGVKGALPAQALAEVWSSLKDEDRATLTDLMSAPTTTA